MLLGEVSECSNMRNFSAVILTADQFEDMEVFFPYFRLLEEGVLVHVAAPTNEIIRGEHGYEMKPDKTLDEVDPDDYGLLIIPGGSPDGAPTTVRKHPRALSITKSFFAKNKPVSSICHGPYTLVSANVIKGRRLTSYWHDGVPKHNFLSSIYCLLRRRLALPRFIPRVSDYCSSVDA